MYFQFVLLFMAAVTSVDMKTVEDLEEELDFLKNKIANMEKYNNQIKDKVENMEDKLEMSKKNMNKIEERTEMIENKVNDIELHVKKTENTVGNSDEKEDNINIEKQTKNNTEERLTYLEELSKLLVMRTCDEMFQFGIKTSGYFFVDPDGPLMGYEPTRVWCDFTDDGMSVTEVLHNSEEMIEIEKCHDPGCYVHPIVYSASDDQIQSLIQLSKQCEQTVRYDCLLAPLKKNGVDYGFWIDKDERPQVYWDGSHSGQHVCGCYYDEKGCIEEETMQTTCNCDAELPELLNDIGSITNMSALPIKKLQFGGITYDIQQAFHTLGRLRCWGRAVYEEGTSCTSIKRSGQFKNGYFNVKKSESANSQLVFCNLTASPGYDEEDGLIEDFIESSEDHFTQVEADIDGIKSAVTAIEENVIDLKYKSSYCGYRKDLTSQVVVISYDKFLLVDNNIPDAEFNLNTGVFTAGLEGVYRFDISFRPVSGGGNYVYFYLQLNGVNIDESVMYSKINTGTHSWEMVGRNLLLNLKKGDNVRLFSGDSYWSHEIIFCVSRVK